MRSELIENNLKDSEKIGFDFDKGSVDLNLTECKTYSSTTDSLSEFDIKTIDDLVKKTLPQMYYLSACLSNHYYSLKNFNMMTKEISKYKSNVEPELIDFFVKVYFWDEDTESFCNTESKINISKQYELDQLIRVDKLVNGFENEIKKSFNQNKKYINFDKDYFRIDVGYVIHHGFGEDSKNVIDRYRIENYKFF